MNKSGFTLIEVMIAAAVSVAVLLGLLGVFIACSDLNASARNLTIAINGAQQKLEEIRNHNFAQILNDYAAGGMPGNLFDPGGEDDNLNSVLDLGEDDNGNGVLDSPLNGGGVVFISLVGGSSDLLQIRIVVSWMQKGGRHVGEDENFNGVLDAGEDDNGNGQLDSPAQIVTLMAER